MPDLYPFPGKRPTRSFYDSQARSLDALATILESAGLRVERHLRVGDQGIALTHEALQSIARSGNPVIDLITGAGYDTLDGIGFNRIGGFHHPLAEAMPAVQGEVQANGWAIVSAVISGAQGWIECDRILGVDRDKCMELLHQCVGRAAPTVDMGVLAARSRFDDRVLLRLCQLAHDGLEAKIEMELGET